MGIFRTMNLPNKVIQWINLDIIENKDFIYIF